MKTPVTTASILTLLEEMHRLAHLNEENPFKVRAFEKARDAIGAQADFEALLARGELTAIPGVGKGIAATIQEFVQTGASAERDALRARLPQGLEQLTELSGLGPKKARVVIEELGIHSVAELEYACRENRLITLPGFGAKTQDKILSAIQTWKAAQGKTLLGDVLEWGEQCSAVLTQQLPAGTWSESGQWRRRWEVLESLDYLVVESAQAEAQKALTSMIQKYGECPVPVELHTVAAADFGSRLFLESSSSAHQQAVLGGGAAQKTADEKTLYAQAGLPWIEPLLRESGFEVQLAKSGTLSELVDASAIRGVFHNHTVRSDGAATAQEMVQAAASLGLSYIGISDHSQSAFYARGLKADILAEQKRELQALQKEFPRTRIFWGVESDILADGNLDYRESVLEQMDFVVASVHSRFQMDQEAMTQRLVQAIRNPYTSMIGHLTGRILLGRAGYALDMERILSEAAEHGVAIELNAHPSRLDIDWRWSTLLRKTGCKVVVNPDAHETAGLAHYRIGALMARKALLPRNQVVNTLDTQDVEKWLQN